MKIFFSLALLLAAITAQAAYVTTTGLNVATNSAVAMATNNAKAYVNGTPNIGVASATSVSATGAIKGDTLVGTNGLTASTGTFTGAGQTVFTNGSTHLNITASRVMMAGAAQNATNVATTAILKGDGTAAVAGTDYMAPAGAVAPAITAVKTANYTATTSDFTVPCDTSGGGFTVTMPATPTNGQLLNVKKVSTDANTLTISGNGHNIDGSATQATASTSRPNFQLQYHTATTQWFIL